MAFFPSLLWAYFLTAPGGPADRTTCIPTPSKLFNLPKQVFHPYLSTFPSTSGVSQPHLPPSTSGALTWSKSFIHILANAILPGQHTAPCQGHARTAPTQPTAAGDATPLHIPTALDSSSLGHYSWSWDLSSVRLEAPRGQEPRCVCPASSQGLTQCLIPSMDSITANNVY